MTKIQKIIINVNSNELAFFNSEGDYVKTGKVNTPEIYQPIVEYCMAHKTTQDIALDEMLGVVVENNPEQAVEYVKQWVEDEYVREGDFRQFDGVIYRVRQTHTTQMNWRPDGKDLDAIWEIPRKQVTEDTTLDDVVIEEIPEYKKPEGAHDTYKYGEVMQFQGKVYMCIHNGADWSPDIVPSYWKLIE